MSDALRVLPAFVTPVVFDGDDAGFRWPSVFDGDDAGFRWLSMFDGDDVRLGWLTAFATCVLPAMDCCCPWLPVDGGV
jgi:hypothetical protein